MFTVYCCDSLSKYYCNEDKISMEVFRTVCKGNTKGLLKNYLLWNKGLCAASQAHDVYNTSCTEAQGSLRKRGSGVIGRARGIGSLL